MPTSSTKMINCIEKQKVPQRSRTRTSSIRLWMVELIQRRLWERSTMNSSGTVVLHTAWGMKTCFRLGNVRYYSQIVAGITPSPIQLTQYKNRTFVRQRPPRASEHEYLASRMLPLITYMCMHSIIIKNTVRSQHGFPHNPMSPKSSIRKVLIIILVTRRAGPASTTTTNDVLT